MMEPTWEVAFDGLQSVAQACSWHWIGAWREAMWPAQCSDFVNIYGPFSAGGKHRPLPDLARLSRVVSKNGLPAEFPSDFAPKWFRLPTLRTPVVKRGQVEQRGERVGSRVVLREACLRHPRTASSRFA